MQRPQKTFYKQAKKEVSKEAEKAAKEIVKLIESVMPANYSISLEERDMVAEIVQGALDKVGTANTKSAEK